MSSSDVYDLRIDATDSIGRDRAPVRLNLRTAGIVFILSSWMLELQLPDVGVNIGNLLLASGCLIASASCAIARFHARVRGLTLMHQDFVYLLYIAFALISVAWSPSPISTVVQSAFLACVWLATVSLGDLSLIVALRFTILLAFTTALASFAVIPLGEIVAFQPATSTGFPELRGIFSHQLRLGLFMSMALGLVTVGWLNHDLDAIVDGRKRAALFIAVFAACMLAAFARLYSAAMILALLLTVALGRAGWRRVSAVLVLGASGALLASAPTALLTFLFDRGFDVTLTGRTLIWARSLTAVDESSLLGHGYASFDHSSFDWMWTFYRPVHPHNSFIQAYFETGTVGLVLTLVLIIVQLRMTLRVADRTGRYPYSLFLVLLATIGSLTGSNYAGKPTILISILLLVLAIEARGIREPNRWARVFSGGSNRKTVANSTELPVSASPPR